MSKSKKYKPAKSFDGDQATIEIDLDSSEHNIELDSALPLVHTLTDDVQLVPDDVAIPNVGIFEHLNMEVINALLEVGQRLRYDLGEWVNEVGDPCKGLGFMISGQVRVDHMDALGWMEIAKLGPGDLFGAMEWLEEKIWTERLVVLDTTEVLFFPAKALKTLSLTYPDLQRQVERYTQRHTLQGLLGTHELFQLLPHESCLKLTDLASLRYVPPNSTLFDPQTRISVLFMIGKGEIKLSSGDRFVQYLGRGEVTNLELALGDEVNELSAVTQEETVLYLLPFEEVERTFAQEGVLHLLQKQAHQRRSRAFGDF